MPPPRRADDRLGGRAPARRRQAGRARRPPGRRARVAARSSTRSPARSRGGEPERPGIVHRLDRDTSGLMVVARSEEAHERLSALVRERALERTYLALVQGRPRSRTGRIEAPIGRDRGDPTRISLDTRLAARRGHALRGRRAAGRSTRCSGCRSRRGGCTRSASISPRSTCRSSATRSTACPSPRSGASSCTRRELAFPHPVHGRADRGSRRSCRPSWPRTSSRLSSSATMGRSSRPSDPVGRLEVDGGRRSSGFHRGPPAFCQSKP